MLTPGREGMGFLGRMGQRLWLLGEMLKHRTVRYAVKTGMATALLAAPAFFDVTRPYFIEYRGEWALISVSCSNTPHEDCVLIYDSISLSSLLLLEQ